MTPLRYDENAEGFTPARPRKVCGILEDPEVLDIFFEVPSDVESGVPLINVEIVDCGVNSEQMNPDDLYKLNAKLREYQFDDLHPKRRK